MIEQIKKQILCVVAHPDDEALGIGGTLIKHTNRGDNVNILILSEGEDSKLDKISKNPDRLNNAKSWAHFTNCTLYKVLSFPDQKLDIVPQLELVKIIEEAILKLVPDIIYTHHPGDINKDHQIAAQVTLAATRPISFHNIKPDIITFETPSSTDQGPHVEPYIYKPNFYVSLDSKFCIKN